MPDDFRPASEFLRTLFARGFVQQCSDVAALDERAQRGELVAYIGFDCTAPSLHVGSLVQIMLLRWLQKCGGKPIALMGGGTTRVGDPSGKDGSRKILTLEAIEENKEGIKRVFSKFLDFGAGPNDALMLDNAEWLTSLNYIDFLRDVGRHFSVNRMLAMDSVKLRLERDQELSFLEFNYMCLQAYDFVELHKRCGCLLQMGGSDQWGNIVTGIDLGRRMGAGQLYGLTSPLLTTASGAKMGKTAQGAVWLDADLLPPFDYWQYWRNCEDRDVGRFLKLFTELDLTKIEALEHGDVNKAKEALAFEATAMVHGREAAERAAETAEEIFKGGGAAANLPTIAIDENALAADGLGVLTAAVAAGLARSNTEARNLIAQGGISINGEAVADPMRKLNLDDVKAGIIRISRGSKRHVNLKPSPSAA